MTAPTTIDARAWLSNYLEGEGEDADSDLAREMLKAFVETVMSAEASATGSRVVNSDYENRAFNIC